MATTAALVRDARRPVLIVGHGARGAQGEVRARADLEIRQVITDVLEELPARQRAVLNLRDVGDHSAEEEPAPSSANGSPRTSRAIAGEGKGGGAAGVGVARRRSVNAIIEGLRRRECGIHGLGLGGSVG